MLATYTFNSEYQPQATPHLPSLRLLEGGKFGPGEYAPALIREEGQLRLRFFRWGLQARWDQAGPRQAPLHCAPAEQLWRQPAYQRPIRQQRCLIPADGYYASPAGLPHPQTYKIARPDGQTFCFAGIYDVYPQADGSLLHAFAIITTPAPAAFRPFGLQMPLLLSRRDEQVWTHPQTPVRRIEELTFSPANHLLRAYPLHELQLTPQEAFEQVAA